MVPGTRGPSASNQRKERKRSGTFRTLLLIFILKGNMKQKPTKKKIMYKDVHVHIYIDSRRNMQMKSVDNTTDSSYCTQSTKHTTAAVLSRQNKQLCTVTVKKT